MSGTGREQDTGIEAQEEETCLDEVQEIIHSDDDASENQSANIPSDVDDESTPVPLQESPSGDSLPVPDEEEHERTRSPHMPDPPAVSDTGYYRPDTRGASEAVGEAPVAPKYRRWNNRSQPPKYDDLPPIRGSKRNSVAHADTGDAGSASSNNPVDVEHDAAANMSDTSSNADELTSFIRSDIDEGPNSGTAVEMRAVSAGGRPLPPAYHSVVETSFTNKPTDEEAATGGDDPPPNYHELHAGEAQINTETAEQRSNEEDIERQSSRIPSPEGSTRGCRRCCEPVDDWCFWYGPDWNSRTKRICMLVSFIMFFVLFFVIFFPLQFTYVKYYQFALQRTKSTGVVDTSRVYQYGCYVLGVDSEFVYLDRTVQTITFNKLSMFTLDNIILAVDVQVFYRIRYDSVGKIWTDYADKYGPVIENVTKTAIRNYGNRFTQVDYFANREEVESMFNQTVQEKLESFGIDVLMVALQGLHLPDRVLERKLTALITRVQIEKEEFYQQQRKIELETDLLIVPIEYRTKEYINNATVQSQAIRTIAATRKAQTVDYAHAGAFQLMMNHLNVTNTGHALSFYYLATLNTMDNFGGVVEYGKKGLVTSGTG